MNNTKRVSRLFESMNMEHSTAENGWLNPTWRSQNSGKKIETAHATFVQTVNCMEIMNVQWEMLQLSSSQHSLTVATRWEQARTLYMSMGARMSSILRIMRTSCVARRICCFFAIKVSITFCSRISATYTIHTLQSGTSHCLAKRIHNWIIMRFRQPVVYVEKLLCQRYFY